MKWFQSLALAVLPLLVSALAPTDEISDADPPQSGYLPTHNIDPARVPTWKKKWTAAFGSTESFYAGPLVYTPSGATKEIIILMSTANIVRIIDSATGAVINSKTLDPPFSAIDSNCNNVKNFVGITGTPLIDSATDIVYFYAKSYLNGQVGPQGDTLQGVYKLHALHIPDLAVVPGFPVSVTGPVSNDPTGHVYFAAGTLMQRPGLTSVGDSIIAGFGGHCDSMNYTGMLVSVSKSKAVVTDIMAMMVPPGSPTNQPADYHLAKGGKAGIWQSGLGLATDLGSNRVFFSTGNGDGAGVNQGPTGPPQSGKIPISSLEQAIVSISVDPVTGLFTQSDYFQPANYALLNKGDLDVSSSGVSLLSPTPFSGGGVNRVAICGSKAGTIYVMDADNLGGYKNGVGASPDAILQTISFPGLHFYSSVGSYPGEGGWIYFCTTGGYLQAWGLIFDSQGRPNFQKVAQSPTTLGCHGSPLITTNQGAAGSAIVWLADSSKGLVAFKAVPVGSTLVQITLATGSGGLTKFKRPVFGSTQAYVDSGSKLIAMGA